jgi:hypothetical protein
MSRRGHQRRRRTGFLKRSFWFLFRRQTTGESSERIASIGLAPICKAGVAEAAAEKYYRECTGNEEPRRIDDAILVGIHGNRAARKAGEEAGEA